MSGLLAVLACFFVMSAAVTLLPSKARAAACAPDIRQALTAPHPPGGTPVEIDCDLALQPSDTVTVPIAYSGAHASGLTLDCHGATLAGAAPGIRALWIRSLKQADGSWDRPHDINVRDCNIRGDVRVEGLGRNGEAEEVRLSSLQSGHTARAQAAAPTRISFDHDTFTAEGGIPLYISPGATEVSVTNSSFLGETVSVALYMDAESGHNSIIGNRFDIHTKWREMIAVDGSADNRIENNLFENPWKGGIFLYRNCGEGGTVRHQEPQHNVVTGNTFHYAHFLVGRPAVWIGSRQGISPYCLFRPKTPFGSSLSALDHAEHNTVTGNHLPGGAERLIVDNDRNNTVSDNR
jgi:parallel beta-helix repeat protein